MNEKKELKPIIQGFVPGLPETGKIKIGRKGEWKKSAKGKEFQPPQKLDHFIITKFDRDESGNFVEDTALMGVLKADKKNVNDKGNIVNIPVMFIYNEIAPNFISRFTCYHGKTLWCYGDGNTAYRLDKDNKSQEVNCPCERCSPDFDGQDKCKPYGMLSVIIRGAKTIGGVWKFRTTSYFNCRNIPSSMLFIKALTGGQLAKIPLNLVIEPQTVTLSDGKQSTIYLVKVVYTDGDIEQLAETGYKAALTDQYRTQRMEALEVEAQKLIAAEIESHDDDVLDEFYPEQADETAKDETAKDEPTAKDKTGKENEPEADEPTTRKPPRLPEPQEQQEPEDAEWNDAEPDDGDASAPDDPADTIQDIFGAPPDTKKQTAKTTEPVSDDTEEDDDISPW